MDSVQFNFYGASAQKALEYLETLRVESLYLWNGEKWSVTVTSNEAISCSFEIGESLDDEWNLVGLLQRVTETFTDVVATVFDEDYDFLLIEAAEHIPPWIEPSNSKNRVFLKNGKLHIIPLDVAASTIREAYTAVLSNDYPASQKAQKVIKERVESAKVQPLVSTRVALPKRPLRFLQAYRDLKGLVIEKFVSRTPEQSNKALSFATIGVSGKCDAVESKLVLTRLQYSQLVFQPFVKPKRWPLSPEVCDIGSRLIIGLEILLSDRNDLCHLYHSFEEETVFEHEAQELKRASDSLAWLDEPDEEEMFGRFADRFNLDLSRDDIDEIEEMIFKESSIYGIEDDEFSGDSEESVESDYDEEQEVLEAIRNDPDLFMKIIEMNAKNGIDSNAFIDQLKGIKVPVPARGPQKGLADLQARPNKTGQDEIIDGSDLSNDEGEVDLLYNETIEQVKKRWAEMSSSDEEDEPLEIDFDEPRVSLRQLHDASREACGFHPIIKR